MFRTLMAGMLAVALAITPAYAAKSKAKAPTKAKAQSWEDLAWGKPAPKKKPVAKTVKKPAKVAPKAEATVKFNPKNKPKPVTLTKTPPKPESPKKEETAKTETDKEKETKPEELASKSADELEKEARELAKKNPQQALGTYERLIERNPNYQYSGDVYSEMYRLAAKSNADPLTQMKYAGFAARDLQQNKSRGPVNQRDVQNLNRAVDDLTTKWIEETTRKILDEANRR